MINTIKGDMDLLKITFSEQKLKMIDENFFKIREAEETLKSILNKTDQIVTLNDLERLETHFDSCVKHMEFNAFEQQVAESHSTYRDEFDKLHEIISK